MAGLGRSTRRVFLAAVGTPVLRRCLAKTDGYIPHCFRVGENGDVAGDFPTAAVSDSSLAGIRLVPVISNYNQDSYDQPALETLLRKRQLLRRFQEAARKLLASARVDGIALDLQGVGMGYGRRFAALAAGVRKLAGRYGKRMYMMLTPADAQRYCPGLLKPVCGSCRIEWFSRRLGRGLSVSRGPVWVTDGCRKS